MKRITTRSVSLWCLGFALFAAASASAASRPYCTGGSSAGYYWWNWSSADQNVACGVVFKQIVAAQRVVTRGYWGSYDTARSNNAVLTCNQGSRNVLGTGADVFTNGINMANQLGWNGCMLRIQ